MRPPKRWLSSIASIARDETAHLQLVLRLLEQRGGALAKSHKNPYASALRGLIRQGTGSQELVDRLLISALIEARSSERFERLAEASADKELSRFYGSLVSSENGHYRLFMGLAKELMSSKEVEGRWEKFIEEESEIIQSQLPGARIHSGCSRGV